MAQSPSVLTGSSQGGTSFDELCNGLVKNYSFNVVDLRNGTTRDRIDALIAKIDETIRSLELHSDKQIELFCIGKTYAPARRGKTFNPTNVDTWRLQGISHRWNDKEGGYKTQGFDGLVVLGAVSRGMLKETRDENVWNQQLYVLALENALITHFAYEACDRRLANKSLQPGNLQTKLSAGYVVYMAFKYQKPEETELSSEFSDHSEQEKTEESNYRFE